MDVRGFIVTGMERFAPGWIQAGDWWTRSGGGYALYDRRGSQATITFTIRTDGSRNLFSGGAQLRWVVGYVDDKNYIRMQLDKDSLLSRRRQQQQD